RARASTDNRHASDFTPRSGLIEWAGSQRATLAIVFTDIVDSTQLAVELGDGTMVAVRRAHFAQSAQLIALHGGRHVKGLGYGDLAVFSNAEAAINYALGLHAHPGHQLLLSRVRFGIHVGPVELTAEDIHGNAVNFAARIGGATKAAKILLSNQALAELE